MTTSRHYQIFPALALATSLLLGLVGQTQSAAAANSTGTGVINTKLCADMNIALATSPSSLADPVATYVGHLRAPLTSLQGTVSALSSDFLAATLASTDKAFTLELSNMATALTHEAGALSGALSQPATKAGTRAFNQFLDKAEVQYQVFHSAWLSFEPSTGSSRLWTSYLNQCASWNSAAYVALGVVNNAEAHALHDTPRGHVFAGITPTELARQAKITRGVELTSNAVAPERSVVVRFLVTGVRAPQPLAFFAPLTTSTTVCVLAPANYPQNQPVLTAC